jgi:hypothetical protein
MRKLALIMCVLVVLSTGFAKELADHTVVVNIDTDGNAHVSEKYTLQLNSSEYIEFEKIAKQTSTDLGIWQAFSPEIQMSVVGELVGLTASASTAGAGNFGNNVVLEYSIAGFSSKVDKVGRDSIFEISRTGFIFYLEDIDKFIIPWKTELQLKFDQSVAKTDVIEVIPSPSQGSMVDGRYTLFWYGSRIDNNFNVKYKVEESIGEFDLASIMRSIYLFFYEDPVYAMAAIVILVLMMIYRKPIIGLILESFGGEEEIEMPKRGV